MLTTGHTPASNANLNEKMASLPSYHRADDIVVVDDMEVSGSVDGTSQQQDAQLQAGIEIQRSARGKVITAANQHLIFKVSKEYRLSDALPKIMLKMRNKDTYGFFLVPVDTSIVTDYLDVIKTPMDLGTMEKKVNRRQYKHIDEFRDDFTLVINNAKTYNHPTTRYYKEAVRLAEVGFNWIEREKEKLEYAERRRKEERERRKHEKHVYEALGISSGYNDRDETSSIADDDAYSINGGNDVGNNMMMDRAGSSTFMRRLTAQKTRSYRETVNQGGRPRIDRSAKGVYRSGLVEVFDEDGSRKKPDFPASIYDTGMVYKSTEFERMLNLGYSNHWTLNRNFLDDALAFQTGEKDASLGQMTTLFTPSMLAAALARISNPEEQQLQTSTSSSNSISTSANVYKPPSKAFEPPLTSRYESFYEPDPVISATHPPVKLSNYTPIGKSASYVLLQDVFGDGIGKWYEESLKQFMGISDTVQLSNSDPESYKNDPLVKTFLKRINHATCNMYSVMNKVAQAAWAGEEVVGGWLGEGTAVQPKTEEVDGDGDANAVKMEVDSAEPIPPTIDYEKEYVVDIRGVKVDLLPALRQEFAIEAIPTLKPLLSSFMNSAINIEMLVSSLVKGTISVPDVTLYKVDSTSLIHDVGKDIRALFVKGVTPEKVADAIRQAEEHVDMLRKDKDKEGNGNFIRAPKLPSHIDGLLKDLESIRRKLLVLAQRLPHEHYAPVPHHLKSFVLDPKFNFGSSVQKPVVKEEAEEGQQSPKPKLSSFDEHGVSGEWFEKEDRYT